MATAAELRTAWWRGKTVHQKGHDIKWYRNALADYTEAERAAFISGYCGQPIEDVIKCSS